MPKAAIHLWVTQGKTDHMATLEDPAVLSRLEEKKKQESSSFSLVGLNILHFLASGEIYVKIRWSSTNQKDKVEASSIRFRDLESEGRPSRRRRRAPEATTQAPQKRKTRSAATETKARKRKRKRIQEEVQPDTTTSTTNSSIITTEGRDDEIDERSKPAAEEEASKDLPGPAQIEVNQEPQNALHQEKNKNIVDAYDEDFDSSDDEAMVHRMKLKRKAQEASIAPAKQKPNETKSRRSCNSSSTPSNSSSTTSRKSGQRRAKKKRRRIATTSSSSSGGSDLGSSFSAPSSSIEASSKQSKKHGFFQDSSSSSSDPITSTTTTSTSVSDGQTNTTNWMKMKRFFTNFV